MTALVRAAGVLAALAAAAVAGACANVDTAPDAVVALGFDTSTVAVVVGDTMRDTLGRAARLRGAVFNARGDTVADAEIGYALAPSDTGVLRLNGAVLVGRASRATAGRVYATAGSIQSLPKAIQVIQRPTRLIVSPSASADSIPYRTGSANPQSAVAAPVQVRITADSAGTAVPSQEVAVRFAVVYGAATVADSVVLLDDRGFTLNSAGAIDRTRFSTVDTTKAAGDAGRRVGLFLKSGAAAADSVVLRATIGYRALYPAVADTVRVVIRVVRIS